MARGRRTTGTTGPGRSISAASTESAPPRYIVVFDRPSEGNLAVTSQILKTGAERGASVRSGLTLLRAKSAGARQPRLYSRLGVCVTDLDEGELRQMRAAENVAAVVPNELRFVPPTPPAPDGAAAGALFPCTPPLAAAHGDCLLAYLQGLRDAAEAAMRFRMASGTPPSTGAPFPDPAAVSLARDIAAKAGHSWCLDLVGVTPGFHLTGSGVKVAVLDTGVDLQHSDFANRFQEGVNAQSFVSGEPVQDGHGHGTHCAGVVGGPVQSSGGTRYGVAPGVDLLVGKVLSNAGSGYDDQILDGIDWAAEQGARIISMSLGSARSTGGAFPVVYERVAENLLHESPGTLIIAAAGNSSARPWFTAPVENPASCPTILAVAAVDSGKRVANFSCAQLDEVGEVNLSGPGVAVYSAWTGGGFRSISGTSMATPHAAGVAALYLEDQPALGAAALWKLLEARAQALGNARDFGKGLVRAPA
jgi:subtilisin